VVTWSCDDETVGTIGTDGLFVALSEGTATITASAENATGTATVTIRPEFSALARIAISPSDFTIAAGNGMTLAATAFDRDGNTVPDTGIAWTSSDETVGTIGADGAFAALSEGTTTITASADGISGTAYVTVEPALPVPTGIELASDTVALKTGETWTFTATVIDQYGNEMDWVRVTWSCPDTSVGVADRTGLFRALAEGTTSVVASVGSLEKTVAVTIAAASTSTSTGGGDSGGGSSGPTFDAGTHQNMKSGETFTFSEMTTSSIDSVSGPAAGTIPNLMLTVKKAVAPSAGGPSAGDVYEYVEIALNWADPKNISNATVVFTIPTAWLDEHGMAPEDVVLMRYVDGAWQTLETEVVGEENGYYRFRATTPGFSTFAIAAVSVNETTPVETVATTAEETNVTVNETGNATVETTTEPTTETTTVPATTPTTPLVYAPFLAPLAFLLWARRKN
jgi:PGF-pre-PGF domain-containing protein